MNPVRPIYLSELFIFLRKKQTSILKAAAACASAAFLLTLFLSTPEYRADAAFKQAKPSHEEGSSLQTLLLSMRPSSDETSAISVMHSRNLLSKAIDKTALQIVPEHPRKFAQLLLSKNFPSAHFQNVHYEQEAPFRFIIAPTSPTTFDLLDQSKKTLIKGTLNKPVLLNHCHFTLTSLPPEKTAYEILPKRKALRELAKKLKIKSARHDPSILQLTYSHPERETAIAFLDTLMDQFQQHLRQEHELLALQQLDYLQKRKEQLGSDYTQTLDQHTAYLKTQGPLNLAEELESLAEPKELYTAKKNQLDLELKKWKEPQLTASLNPIFSSADMSGLTIDTAEKLHQTYAEEHQQQLAQIASLETLSDKISSDTFEISTLSQVLSDEMSQKLVQRASDISLQLADRPNYSEKELARLASSLATQKTFLQEHLLKKIDLLHTQRELTEQKMAHLNQISLDLIGKEKKLVEEKLSEINTKMETLPEKWRLENELKFKKELMMQIIEGVTQLTESKVVNHHLFHIASKPLDPADAPPTREPHHLLLYATIGGLLGAFFFTISSFLRAILRGLPISPDYLRHLQIPFASDILRFAPRIEPHAAVALIACRSSKTLIAHLAHQGKKILRVVHGLQEQFQPHEDHHLIVTRHVSAAKLSEWKQEYDHILLEIESLDTAAAYRSQVDQLIVQLNETPPEELAPFDPRKLHCLF